jgi:putative membrane protein
MPKTTAWLVLALPALALAACKPAQDQSDASATPSDDVTASDTPVSDASSDTTADSMGAKVKNAADRAGGMLASAAAGLTPENYVDKATAGDLFEIESSKIILTKTADPQIRDFAHMMIKAHEASTAKIHEAESQSNIAIQPARLPSGLQDKLDAIRAATGPAADQLYLKAQREGHADALTLHQTYAHIGTNPQLRAAANAIVPEVQKHIDALHKMRGDNA